MRSRPPLPVQPAPHRPGVVDDAIGDAEKALARVRNLYTSQAEHKWETYARQLRSRVQSQRTELRRLNAKMHSLRGDVHLAQEEAAEIDQQRCDAVNELRDRLDRCERSMDVLAEGLCRLKPLMRQESYDEAVQAVDALRKVLSPASRDSQETT